MVNIPLSKPEISEEDITAVNQVLRSGQLAFGSVQRRFEEQFAQFCDVDHALAVSSGTAALHLAVELSGIKEGDEVIVSPFSFIASSNVVLYQNAKPVFVDIEEETFGIDPALIPAAISEKTKAILPTHVFGHPCKIEEISSLCKQNSLSLIEDNCESLGSSIVSNNGVKKAGQFGDYVAYGFYPNKLMTTGEGGMLVLKDAAQLERATALRNQGRGTMKGLHLIHEILGYNYRLSDIQSALGLSQLSRLTDTIVKRDRIVSKYNELFNDVSGVQIPKSLDSYNPAWFVYCIRVSEKRRDPLIKFLADAGIQTRPYFYPPIHLQPFYRQRFGTQPENFPVAEKVSKEIIALPFFNQLTEDQIEQVVAAVREGLKRL